MIKSACECYYDAALRKQSTNCPVHDPYIKCELLEKHIDQLESEIAELRKDRARLARKEMSIVTDKLSPTKPLTFDDDVKSSDLTSEPEEGTLSGKPVDLKSMEEINNRLFNAPRGGKEVKDVKKP